jgi:hypothetical protein
VNEDFIEVGNSSMNGDGERETTGYSPESGRRDPTPSSGGVGVGSKLLDAPQGHRTERGGVSSLSREVQREEWSKFLGRWEWEWFATLTFRHEIHPEAADKRFRVLISMGNRELYGPRWSKKRRGIRWIRALEYQRRGVIHFHALLSGIGNLRRLSYMDRWNRMAGFAKIEPIKNAEAVRRYVSKYVIKGGEIDLGGIWLDPPEVRPLPFITNPVGQASGPDSA